MIGSVPAAQHHTIRMRQLPGEAELRVPRVLSRDVYACVCAGPGHAGRHRSLEIRRDCEALKCACCGWILIRQGVIKVPIASQSIADIAEPLISESQVECEPGRNLEVILNVEVAVPDPKCAVKQTWQIDRFVDVAGASQQQVWEAEEDHARDVVKLRLVVLRPFDAAAKAQRVTA